MGAAAPVAPTAQAQISINIGVQPVCSYGYYDYSPYSCAPMGFYGPGYFHNGIFLGMGPWAGWGYGHGWGGHRFVNDGGGRYHGGGGEAAGRAFAGHPDHMSEGRGGGRPEGNHPSPGMRNQGGMNHPAGGHPAEARPGASHGGQPHAAAPHGGGGQAHPGGSPHGGGAPRGGGGGHEASPRDK